MKISRLEEITLYLATKSTGLDGERGEELVEQGKYDALVEYVYNDEVAIASYGADVDKIHRIATVKNELEKLLIPKVRNKTDNVSKYLIKYQDNYYIIVKVTPRYIDIKWR